MDSLKKILGSRKIAQAPDEIKIIQNYILKKYKSPCKVKVQRGAFIVTVKNSGLASTLQLERQYLIDVCKIDANKLVIRTGQ